jgi:hypothetical protein
MKAPLFHIGDLVSCPGVIGIVIAIQHAQFLVDSDNIDKKVDAELSALDPLWRGRYVYVLRREGTSFKEKYVTVPEYPLILRKESSLDRE